MKKGFFLIATAVVLAACSHSEKTKDSARNNPAPLPAERADYASLKAAFDDKSETPALGRMRSFRISANSPVAPLLDKNSKAKPFVIFSLHGLGPDIDTLVVKTQAVSLDMQKVGMMQPRVYAMKNGAVTELKNEEYFHRSEIGACLTSFYSFAIKDLTADGTKILIANAADDFDHSMGMILADNPNLKLEKTNGLCSMVDIFPHQTGYLEVSVK